MPDLTIIKPKISDKHDDPFWYDGEIAKCGKYMLIAAGDIRIYCTKHKEETGFSELCYDGKERNCCCLYPKDDRDIAFGSDEDQPFYFGNNNWFEIIGINQDDDPGYNASFSYDEAIEALIDLANQ